MNPDNQVAKLSAAGEAALAQWPAKPKTGLGRILRHMLPHKLLKLLRKADATEFQVARLTLANAELSARLSRLDIESARRKDIYEKARKAWDSGDFQPRRNIRAHDEAIFTGATFPFPPEIFGAEGKPWISIVDVGAQDLISEDHIYKPLQQAGRTQIIGFEPLNEDGSRRSDADVEMIDRFIGSGKAGTFYITDFDPASSLFRPNEAFLADYQSLPEMLQVVDTKSVTTSRLDDIVEIESCDFLKVDVQGAERDVFEGASRILDHTLVVHTETEFARVYAGQPLFADIDAFLNGRGFELIDLMNAGYNRFKALYGKESSGSRLLWAEAIYFKAPRNVGSSCDLLKAAFIAHVNYGMYDLAAHFIEAYDGREGTALLTVYRQAAEAPESVLL